MQPCTEMERVLDLLIENTLRMHEGEDVEERQEALLDYLISIERNIL